MMYYDKIFTGYSNSITVGYDFSIKLKVSASDPTKQTAMSKDFELIAQNQLSARSSVYNTAALEF